MGGSRLAIIIPALNEVATIGDVVSRSLSFGDVIVVDDGSSDGTEQRARIVGAHVILNPGPHGYDRAIEAGFKESDRLGYEYVITMDADGEHDPEILESFRSALVADGVPLVIGQRAQPQRLTEALMARYFHWRFGIRDPLCGMKGYKIDLYRENGGFDHFYSIGTELTFYAARRGYGFLQVPVGGTPRKDTPRFGHTFKVNYLIGRALLRLILLDLKARMVSTRPITGNSSH